MKPPEGISEEVWSKAAGVRLCVFDVDGVLTDGGLYYGPSGEALKRFDVKDGHGIVMARLSGLPCAVLTARVSEAVTVRAKELQLVAVIQGRRDKGVALEELCRAQGIGLEACAYMGDDTTDLAPLERAGLSACPSDAVPEVLAAAALVVSRPGGFGAARELLELCLKASGRWGAVLARMRSAST